MFVIVVFWLGCDMPSGLIFFVPALLLSMLTPLFLHSSLFRSCCPHALGETLLQEFRMSYSHSDFYLPFSRGEIVCLCRSVVYQYQIKLGPFIQVFCVRDQSLCVPLTVLVSWRRGSRDCGVQSTVHYLTEMWVALTFYVWLMKISHKSFGTCTSWDIRTISVSYVHVLG